MLSKIDEVISKPIRIILMVGFFLYFMGNALGDFLWYAIH
jgi:hypothetical protein